MRTTSVLVWWLKLTKVNGILFRYGLETPTLVIELWLRALMGLASWNSNKNVLFLIDLLCKEAFLKSELRARVKNIFAEFLEVSNQAFPL
jgi:hypothetical protein